MREAIIAADAGVETKSVLGDVSDDELLARFVASRDEAAFAQLVSRHAPLVMGVCQRAVANRQDAEDAFQATFLILVRKAATLRNAASLPAWLHKTAHRTALKARAAAARRREQPLEVDSMLASEPLSIIAADFDRTVLDQELNRLPEKYRLPLFLCAIEGKSREEAARQLGWSQGVLKGRLERGRQLLRRRLALSGVTLAAAAWTTAVAGSSSATASTTVSASLVASTVQAGVQHAAGHGVVGYVSQNALSLAQGSLPVMTLTSKVMFGSLAILTLAVAGANLLPASPGKTGNGESSGYFLEGTLVTSPSAEVALLAEGEGPKTGARDGDAPRTGARDGDAPRTGARDGDAPRTGARDGDAPRTGARDGDAPRTGARDGEGTRPAGGEQPASGLANFRPQTQREAALYQFIIQMQGELAELRRELNQVRGGQGGTTPSSPGESQSELPDGTALALPANFDRSSEGRVFKAYDKNGDMQITADEWMAMRAIAPNDTARRQLETRRFQEADPNSDGQMNAAEFYYWYTKGRFQNNGGAGARVLQGEGAPRSGARDGEGSKPGARDGER